MNPVATEQDSIIVTRLNGPVAAEGLLAVFEAIAAEEGWCPGGQLRAYPEACHLAAQVRGTIVGGIQVVLPQASVLPYQAVWPEVEIPGAQRLAEVTIMAIRPEWRGRPSLFWPLCTELWRFCIAEQVQCLILQATPRMLERYRRIGWPLEVVGDLRAHWGEACYLCRLDVRQVAGALMELALRFPSYRGLIEQALQPGIRSACVPVSTLP
jgi:hypothetical protein